MGVVDMTDDTENVRRELIANQHPTNLETLSLQYGRVWDTQQLVEEFEVIGFAAPFVVVRRRADKMRGSLEFQHDPRYYYKWTEDR